MSYVDGIVEKFGGVRVMARELDKPTSTVGSWAARGSIPDDEKPSVLARARMLDLGLVEADFFPRCAEEDAA